MSESCAAGSVPCAPYDLLRFDRDRWREQAENSKRDADRFRSLARDAESRTVGLGLRAVEYQRTMDTQAFRISEQDARIGNLLAEIEAVRGHHGAAITATERLREALRTLADHHHRTKVGSKLHDPKNQGWTDCPCLTCRGAKEAIDA